MKVDVTRRSGMVDGAGGPSGAGAAWCSVPLDASGAAGRVAGAVVRGPEGCGARVRVTAGVGCGGVVDAETRGSGGATDAVTRG
jgi:hypothetical protein